MPILSPIPFLLRKDRTPEPEPPAPGEATSPNLSLTGDHEHLPTKSPTGGALSNTS